MKMQVKEEVELIKD